MDDQDVPVRSVKRSYAVVAAIRDRERAGVTELSDALALPKSTVHNHLRSLEALGYLIGDQGEYRLSTKYLRLGREARNIHAVFLHGREEIRNLREQSTAYCQLVSEENGMATILLATGWHDEERSPTARHVYPTHGHLHTNAPGKAILASFSEGRIAEILDRYGLPGRTERTLTDENELLDHLGAIRERGYAIDRGEMIDGMAGVGCGITTTEVVYGAVGAYGPASDIARSIQSGELPRQVRTTAEAIRDNIVFGTRG